MRLLPGVLAFSAFLLPAQEDTTRLLRFPDLHGDTVVFCHAGDLWTAPVEGGTARRLTSHPGLELFPRFSPDGGRIAFTGQIDGDEQVYVIPAEGGEPRQLTWYPARGPLPDRWGFDHQVLDWTPDGRAVLFRSLREAWTLSRPRLFLVEVDGGLPRPLPMPVAGAGAFSPDGQRLVYSPLFRDFRTWKRYEGGWAQNLWIFDSRSREARQITDHVRSERDPMWIGERILFTSDRTGTLNLFSYEPEADRLTQETTSERWDVRWPAAAGPGDGRVVFELGGELQVYDLGARERRKIPIRVPDEGLWSRPGHEDVSDEVAGFGLGPRGKRVLVVAHGDVFSVPVEHGPVRNLTRTPGAHDRAAAWSPDGKRIAFVSDRSGEEQIWRVDHLGREEPLQVTAGLAVRLGRPVWSPDAKLIAFGDKDGVLRVVEMESGEMVRVADEPHGRIDDAVWSPDGAYLAFTMSEANRFATVWIWDRAAGNLHRATPPHTWDSSPAWSADGKRLFFLGRRSFAPRIGNLEWNYQLDRQDGVFALALRKDLPSLLPPRSDEAAEGEEEEKKDEGGQEGDPPEVAPIDFDGLTGRVERLPIAFDNLGSLRAVEGALLYVRRPAFYYGRDSVVEPELRAYDLAGRAEDTLAEGLSGFALSAGGGKVLVREGGKFALLDARKGGADSRRAVAVDDLGMRRDPRAEWRQIFHEVWRRYRDFFYVANMHGFDWEALRQQYAALLPHVRHRADLNYVIGEMIAELNVGHAYIAGGDWERPERHPVALPGCEFELDGDAGRYRIARILPGENGDPDYRSPLTRVGVDVREGQYVLAIHGEELRAGDNPYRLLRDRADHPVRLLVNGQPTADGARDVTFEPLTSESDLRYLAWTRDKRRRVEQLSGGRLGYLHLPDMGADGLREFIKWFYPQNQREGLVIDVRANGGGNVSQMLLERLDRELLMGSFGRTTGYRPYPATAYHGHLVCVLDQNSASDGDIFPAMFRKAGLGKLVGKRSWGGVIGITNRGNLIDGGTVYVPEFGNTELFEEGWTIEGHGVAPDIEVDNDVEALLAGRDPQLEKAVEVLLKQVTENPLPDPQRPPDPIKTGR